MRAFVNETDIGNVKAGQSATVTVDAFPTRRFVGIVEQVQPEAVVQSSVTMFPVLVSLDNSDGALMPGMNGQVVMDITRRDNVIAVPSDAIRNARDAATVAPVLGVNPDSLKAAQAAARAARGFGGGAGATASSTAASGDTTRRRTFGAANSTQSAAGGQGAASGTASSTGRRFGGGGGGGAGGGGGGSGGGGAAGGGAGGTGRTGGALFVFVKKGDTYSPRVVRVGVSDFDYTEIVSGVQQGEQVALLGPAVLEAQREQVQARVRAGTGGGLQQTTTPAAGGAAGAGGGARGGGGGGGRPPGT